jgi:hypothetical protein
VHATLFEIYFKDPFLAYVYASSILYFVALYQAYEVLQYIRQDKTFSPATVKVLRTIKYCARALVVCILGAEAYFFIVQRGKDDIAGGVAIGLFFIVISAAIATLAALYERKVQKATNLIRSTS